RRIVPARTIAAIRAITVSTSTPEPRAISSNGSRTKPSTLSSEIASIFALIGSLYSIGSMQINRIFGRDCPTREKSLGRFLLIVHAHPIAQPLRPLLECLMQPGALVRRQNGRETILPARQNSLSLVKIDRASIGQLIVNLLENRTDFLIL